MKYSYKQQDFWLLTLWVAIGILLRFYHLSLKSMWGDEWATLIFSLGHGFRGIPLDTIIPIETLLEPLRFQPNTPVQAVTKHLFSESNHPPLYFWLTHFWLRFWSEPGAYISIWTGRSLAALFGVCLIPINFALGWWISRKKSVGHFAAIAMAISPYGVYLSQEARHYTLAMIWISLSFGCLVAIIRQQQQQKKPAFWLIFLWIVCNSFGIASHYFMLLSLWSQGLVLDFFDLKEITHSWQSKPKFSQLLPNHWRRIIAGAIATALMVFILMSQWDSQTEGELTSWLNQDYGLSFEAFVPILRSLAWLLTMVLIPPLEVKNTGVIIVSAVVTVVILLWIVPKSITALRKLNDHLELHIVLLFIGANLLTLLGIVYILKIDLSLAPRYHFIYFPALTIVLGYLLNYFWEKPQSSGNFWQQSNRATSIILSLIILSSAIFVNFDLAYRKPEDGKAIAKLLPQRLNEYPTILATHYYEVAVTRTQIGLAWELQDLQTEFPFQFLLLDDFYEQNLAAQILEKIVDQLPETTQILMFNTHFAPPLDKCELFPDDGQRVNGYSYQKYLCRK